MIRLFEGCRAGGKNENDAGRLLKDEFPPTGDPVLNGQPAEYRTVSSKAASGAPVLRFDSMDAVAAERYRMIRTRIVQHPARPRVICISSATAGDGKTVNALNIAGSLSLKKDTTAVIVDVDLRCPQIARVLGVADSAGLADVLAGDCSLRQTLVRIAEMPSLYFLPAGNYRQNPAELLDSERWRTVIDALRKEFDFVVLDCPPIGVVADCDLIYAIADGIILVARPGHSSRSLLYRAIEHAPKEKFLGVVVNCAEDWFLWRTQEASYYRYVHAKG